MPKSSKARYGTGSITKLKDGRSRLRFYHNGKQHTVTGKTQRECIDLRDRRIESISGIAVVSPGLSLSEFILEKYLPVAKSHWQYSTYELQSGVLKNHVLRHFGATKLVDVNADLINALYSRLRTPIDGSSPISVEQVGWVHSYLTTALNYAVEHGYVETNVMAKVAKPKRTTFKAKPPSLSLVEAEKLVKFAATIQDRALYATAIDSGMRQGELFGLTWGNVDFDRCRITIEKSLGKIGKGVIGTKPPKTKRSNRILPMPKQTMAKLREHFEEQKRLGFTGQANMFVFTDSLGGPLRKDHFRQRNFLPLLRRAGLDGRGLQFRFLRHVANSLLIADRRISIADASERLGHASIRMTLETYAHVMPNGQERIAEILDEIRTE